MQELEINGYTITIDIATDKVDNKLLCELENRIADIVDECGFLFLGGNVRARHFNRIN
ncbi:MAG: hypothetical protein ACRDD7_08915 [Peptostreptococcaceae bacterium]